MAPAMFSDKCVSQQLQSSQGSEQGGGADIAPTTFLENVVLQQWCGTQVPRHSCIAIGRAAAVPLQFVILK